HTVVSPEAFLERKHCYGTKLITASGGENNKQLIEKMSLVSQSSSKAAEGAVVKKTAQICIIPPGVKPLQLGAVLVSSTKKSCVLYNTIYPPKAVLEGHVV
ncbi:unnamed protein product, partial [Bubo scandiacus]